MEQENFVSKWLNNSFKIKQEALDLRSTPITLPGFPMTTDIQQQANNRNLFSKMSTDFWQQARGPPLTPQALANNLMQISSSTTPTNLSSNPLPSQGSQGSGSPLTGNGPLLSPTSLHHLAMVNQQQNQSLMNLAGAGAGSSNPSLTPSSAADHLSTGQLTPIQMAIAAQQQQQAHQHAAQQQQIQPSLQGQQQPNNPQNSQLTPNQQQLAPIPPQSSTPGGNSTPDIKLNAEKFVNDLQVSDNFFLQVHFFTSASLKF